MRKFGSAVNKCLESKYWYLFWVAYGLFFICWHGTKFPTYEEGNILFVWWVFVVIYFAVTVLWAWFGLKRENLKGWMQGWTEHAEIINRLRRETANVNHNTKPKR